MVDTPAKSADTLTVGMLAQRLDGMDEAIRLLQAAVDRMPTPALVQADIDALRDLTDANFKALREVMEAKFEGNKVALDAALKTQKEASDKIESSFTKQIDSVQGTIGTLAKTTDDKIGDLKDRFNTGAGRSKGLSEGWGILVGAVGVVATVITIVVVLVNRGA